MSGAVASPAQAAEPTALGPIGDWLALVLSPVEIGSWRFSPARLVAAALLFAALILLFRLLRRWLAAVLHSPGRLDSSAAHSVDKAIGYTGVTLAALSALSVAGLDITNIAIVAGALSVGIGFGLQSIVNNFVSGLILLAERPVKVGDWIEIKGHRGRVRRISVRSTEIETPDQARIFVPNADLIANPLVNLTPGEPRGMAVVRVGVPHAADPARVRLILADAAASSALLARDPPPAISFDEIGPSALQFSIRAGVPDVGGVGAAETDLRSLVVAALNQSGVGIARPQTDVHLRDLDAVRAVVLRALEERERRARMADAEPVGKPAG